MTTNIFEYATRNKLRFFTTRGLISVEQLWDVPLRSSDGFNLDAVAKAENKAWKELSSESSRTSAASARWSNRPMLEQAVFMSTEVVRLVRKTCPCGWLPPIHLTVTAIDVKVSFDCPACGRRLEMVTKQVRTVTP